MVSQIKPIALTPISIVPSMPEYRAILSWNFSEEAFYEKQIRRLLEDDIPQRMLNRFRLAWIYRDPDANIVGFGTLDICKDYDLFTDGKSHCYIPLLAVNPSFQKRGHGRSIVQHLIATSIMIARSTANISDFLFLDVYVANLKALALYGKCGFVALNPDNPISDPQENGEPYIIMAKKVSAPPMISL